MSYVQAFILGALQAVTEFLPVSSSGHLVFFPSLLGWETQSLFFDISIHFATALAIIAYFRHDLAAILTSLWQNFNAHWFSFNQYAPQAKLGLYIVLGTIPAAVAGLFLQDIIETTFRSVSSVVLFLFVGSFIMFAAELFIGRKNRVVSELTAVKALIVGLFQSLALFSGVSRSGATISGGVFVNLSRESAARFSFLLSLPIVLGVSAVSFVTSYNSALVEIGLGPLLMGFFSSLIFGLLAIKYLLQYLKTRTLYVFIVYRLVLAILLLIFVI